MTDIVKHWHGISTFRILARAKTQGEPLSADITFANLAAGLPGADGGADAGTDGGTDGGTAVDGGDAGPDLDGGDGGPNTGQDAGPDAGPGSDAGHVGSDGGDGGEDPAGCGCSNASGPELLGLWMLSQVALLRRRRK